MAKAFYEIFKGPFKADENCCYIWCNDGTQVCFDVMDERDASLGKRIADCLNDAPCKQEFYDIGISADGQYICDGHSPLLCVRGWGHLTGTGGLNLSSKEAREIQDEFVRWAAEQLGGFVCGETRLSIAQENIKDRDTLIKFYSDFVTHCRDNVSALTYDVFECIDGCDALESKGVLHNCPTVMHNGKLCIEFTVDGEKRYAEWYRETKYACWQRCEYEDSYYGYILLPDAADDEEFEEVGDMVRCFCFWYSC
jgi:hypothetical protein